MIRSFHAIILGAPGSGKGTISSRIIRKFDMKHISSGDILRNNVLNKTKLGLDAKKYMDKGQLVPDQVMVNLISDELKKYSGTSWLLDGFPRTKSQALELSQSTPVDVAVNLVVPFDVIIQRVQGRWVHLPSGRVYNTDFNAPKVPGVDDVTGEKLVQREDDKPEAVQKRLQIYSETTQPVLDFYKENGALEEFYGKTSDEIWPLGAMRKKSMLLAFDFDHTLVDDNSNMVSRNLLPDPSSLPEESVMLPAVESWTIFMNQVFLHLHKSKITEEQIRAAIRAVPAIEGMDTLLELLRGKDQFEVIIISDSNQIFIEEWVKARNLYGSVVKTVITNPAVFDEAGLLKVSYYETQTHCALSEPNLCKGDALEMYIKQRAKENICFQHIAFVGDGSNDLCPALRLSENDLVFARVGYSLMKKIDEKKFNVSGKVYPWKNGDDIIQVLKNQYKLL